MGIQRWDIDTERVRMDMSSEGIFVLLSDHRRVVAELTKAHQDNLDSWLHQREEIAFLRAELAAKSKDAARYAWLREKGRFNGFSVEHDTPAWVRTYSETSLDAAIDSAMGEGNDPAKA